MRITIILQLLLAAALNASAAVETNNITFSQSDLIFLPGGPPPDAVGYMSSIVFRGGGYHGDWFYSQNGANLVRYSSTADMSAEWYRLDYGDEFSPATYPTKPYPLNIPFDISLDISSVPFYLGVHTYLDPSSGFGGFGWAKMVNDFDGLRLLECGFSFNNKGVYVGTFNEVPEPSAATLLTLGLAISAALFSKSSR